METSGTWGLPATLARLRHRLHRPGSRCRQPKIGNPGTAGNAESEFRV